RMLTELSGEADILFGEFQDFPDQRLIGVESLTDDAFAIKALFGKIPYQGGQAADGIERQSHSLPYIAYGALMMHFRNGRDNSSAVATIFPEDVLHHLLAALMLEVDINIGWFIACRRDEALEQQIELRR